MDEREKMYELIDGFDALSTPTDGFRHHLADYLIANGVTFKEREAQEPLTIEELKQMHGQPVWIEGENAWGIINIDSYGQWSGKPFVTFFYHTVRCDYDIQRRNLKCYRHKPKEEKK